MSDLKIKDFNNSVTNTWCPGCGNHGILMSVKKALVNLGRPVEETCITTGVGCSSKFNHFVNTYGFESLHGRSLPVASAIHLSNHNLNVIALGGDGDGYGIGMEHFMHAMRRNYNITYIVTNNQIYGLTTGQYSPTTEKGTKTASSPHGSLEDPVNPLKLALASDGVTYIARGFAGDIKHLSELILQGMQHRGFSFIDVLQPCVTFNKVNTYDFFRDRVYKLEEEEGFDKSNIKHAQEKAEERGDKIPTGVFYQVDKPCYEDSIEALKEKTLVEQDIENVDVTSLYKEYI